jgi:hypothetical protein
MKAGLFDRAEAAWRALEGTPFEAEARLALLSLYERSRDWARAAEVARSSKRAAAARSPAHGALRVRTGARRPTPRAARRRLGRLLQRAPGRAEAPRPLRAGGPAPGKRQAACRRAGRLGRPARTQSGGLPAGGRPTTPPARGLRRQASRARRAGRGATLPAALPGVELLRALGRLDGDAATDACRACWTAPAAAPQPVGRTGLLLEVPPERWTEDAWPAPCARPWRRAAKPLQRYRCAACGFEAQHYFWQCPGCLSWDSYPPQRIDAL